jgi:predicted nucleic acid-binding protein
LEDLKPYSRLTEAIFAALAEGKFTAVLSTISMTELLVKPFAEGKKEAVEACEVFLQGLPNSRWVPPRPEIAKEAARLRASYRLRTPDALLIATALVEGAKAFLTNDTDLKRVEAEEKLRILVLEEYLD